MVDNISKPFTFYSNTYAKASEVNADFDTLYTGTNACINQANANATNITNLGTNKADKNGSSTNTFAVADAVNNVDAVNKQTLMKYINNSLDYISGLQIRKDSGSPNDTIIVSTGSCYDSTKSVVLALTAETSKQNTNQGASSTYYVYIIGDNAGTSVDILISASSSDPALPTGYTKYRKIGKYTTDSGSHIQYIYNGTDTFPETQATVIKAYSSGSTGYILYSNNYLIQWFRVNNSSSSTLTANLPLTYGNTNYSIAGANKLATAGATYTATPLEISNNKFTFYLTHGTNVVEYIDWITTGYKS